MTANRPPFICLNTLQRWELPDLNSGISYD